mmetsp:Transcript_9493/g.31738  ORF Transcript_9493/g.31738 Transcript_9493/m.31738 type:complete len:108 (+) Transcript_9493:273-596(+)
MMRRFIHSDVFIKQKAFLRSELWISALLHAVLVYFRNRLTPTDWNIASMRSSLALEVSFVLSLMVLLKLYTGFVYFVSVEKSLVKATSRLQVLANEASHVLSDAIEG